MKAKKKHSIDPLLGRERESTQRSTTDGLLDIHQTIRTLRQEKKLSGVELCKRAGDLDPRTLTALEKGRIKNPSMRTLDSLSRGLGVAVSDLFRLAEMNKDSYLYQGNPKGAFQMDFPSLGLKAISFTPRIRNFFCGKLIFSARCLVDHTFLKHPLPIFISILIGRFEIHIETKKFNLKEGENLFFNGHFKHAFFNPLQRESVLWMVTAPSFL